jgi:lipoprotein-anchoring transpeptidase ErfK/SrfK
METAASSSSGLSPRAERILRAQCALVRQGLSPGSLDGALGGQTSAAIQAYFRREGKAAPGDSNAVAELALSLAVPLLANYTVTSNDLARLLPLSKTWLGKSQQPRLDYETVLESAAEKSQSHPNLIRQLNPGIDWTNLAAGVALRIPNVEFPAPGQKAGFIRISLGVKTLEAFDENTNLLAHFPCSIAQRVEKRPVGELRVAVLAPNPNYTFDPEVFPESAEARELNRKLILQPGPNNPVGTVWIGLDKPGYGIHGTPRPEEVGRTESHGCFRLANWNAEFLLRLISVGTPVYVEP